MSTAQASRLRQWVHYFIPRETARRAVVLVVALGPIPAYFRERFAVALGVELAGNEVPRRVYFEGPRVVLGTGTSVVPGTRFTGGCAISVADDQVVRGVVTTEAPVPLPLSSSCRFDRPLIIAPESDRN